MFPLLVWSAACAPQAPLQTKVEVWVPPLGVDEDLDQDGLVDEDEALLGTADDDPDTDGDEIDDGEELRAGADPTRPDTDGDEVDDGEEIELGSDPTEPDSDGGGAWDGEELLAGTDLSDPRDDDQAAVPGAFVGGGGCDHTSEVPTGLPGLLVCVALLRNRRVPR